MGHSDTHRQIHEAFNTRAFDRIIEQLAPGFVFEDHPQGLTIKEVPDLRTWWASWTGAFSDARVSDATYLEGPDFSVATFHARGTNDGAFGAMQPTGRSIDVPFCDIAHFASDGRLLSNEFFYDLATLMAQLGAGSAEAVSGELEASVRELFAALDRMDLPALQERFDPQGQGVDELSRSWMRGEARLSDYFHEMEGMLTEVRSELSDVQEVLWGDTGLVTGWLEQDYTLGGEPQHVSAPTTVVLRRGPERWRAALIHTVPLPPED